MASQKPNRKRPVEVIDLTDEDNTTSILSSQSQSQRANKSQKLTSSQSGPSKYGPSSSSSSYQAASQRQGLHQSQADPYDGEFSDDELEDALLSQSFDDRDRYVLYGTLQTKAVGCRFYNGYVTMGEMVLLRREPENKYDANAIVVNNVRVSTSSRHVEFTRRTNNVIKRESKSGIFPEPSR
jgi:SWI/SNF-related matrix-associated actin-dependent regulator of chromatin subfamily A3